MRKWILEIEGAFPSNDPNRPGKEMFLYGIYDSKKEAIAASDAADGRGGLPGGSGPLKIRRAYISQDMWEDELRRREDKELAELEAEYLDV